MNQISGTTRVVALLGDPIRHSRSPHMHNMAFGLSEVDLVYLCVTTPKGQIREALNAMWQIGAVGGNITFPHKSEAIQWIDELTPDAESIGAVNTFKMDDQTRTIKGYNTDGRGFIRSLEESKISFRDKKVVLVGVGGAGRAIAINLAMEGVKELVLCDLIPERCQQAKRQMVEHQWIDAEQVVIIPPGEENIEVELEEASLLINATPVGMVDPEQSVITSPSKLPQGLFVYDIIYEPRVTKLMKIAEQAGCQTMNGISMMLWQGAIAYEIWTGQEMPVEKIRSILLEG